MKGQPKASNRWKIKNQLNKVEHAWWQTDLESGWVRLLPYHLRARLGQSQEMLCFPGSQLSLRVFIPVLCLPSPEYAGYKAILSSFSITSRNSSCRQICYQSLTLEFEKTTQQQKPVVSCKEYVTFVFYFSIGVRGGERRGGENIFLLLLKNFQDLLAVRNSPGFSLDGRVESIKPVISVIRCL